MFPLSNVKLMDTIVFVSALIFGLSVGVSVGALTWLVYSSINPLGSAGLSLLVILIVSETVYAFLGSLARRSFSLDEGNTPAKRLLWGLLGLVGALIYDISTIIPPSLLAGAPLKVAVFGLLPAIPFLLAHEISDFVFFATLGPVLVSAILKAKKSNGIQLKSR